MGYKRKLNKHEKRKKRGKYMDHLERGTSPPRTSRYREHIDEKSDDGITVNDAQEFYKIVNHEGSLEWSDNTNASIFQPLSNKRKFHHFVGTDEKEYLSTKGPNINKSIGSISCEDTDIEKYDVENYQNPTRMNIPLNRIGTTDLEDSSHDYDDQNYGSDTLEDGEDFWSTFAGNFELESKLRNHDLDKIPQAYFVVTEAEMLYALTEFQEKYSLPVTALEDLCKMQNSFLNSAILPDTRYKLDQLLRNKDSVEYHAVCLACSVYLRKFDPSERTILCKKCNKNVPVKGNDGNFFVIFNTQDEVKNLIEKHQESYVEVLNHKEEPNVFKDICNGVKYKEFVKSLPLNERDSYVTCTFNSDGSPVFKNSNYSVWPIQMVLNELPPQIRFDNSIICALWFGRCKPLMDVFLRAFAKKINSINDETIPCEINGVIKNLKLYPICCCADAVARAPMQGLIQFNGRFGCNWCYHPGIPVKSKKKKVIKYPLLDSVPKRRTLKKMLKHMREKLKKSAPVYGVKKISALIHCKWFDLVDGFVVDVMHNTFLGICLQFITYWLEKPGYAYYIKRYINFIDSILDSIQVPKQIARLTRSIKDRKQWNSRDWENWLLFYSVPILQLIPDFNIYAQHWELLVEAIHILYSECITKAELLRAERLLNKFVGGVEELYGQSAMTFNVHQVLHLAESVANWGPLWAHNGYAFESGNGKIVRMVKAANGVLPQICRRIEYKTSSIKLQKHILDYYEDSPVIEFVSRLRNTHTDKSVVISKNRYFGNPHFIDESTTRALNITLKKPVSYNKMVKNNCLFTSHKQHTPRSKNCFVQTKNGQFIQIVRFIVDEVNKKELTVYNRVYTERSYVNCRKIEKISSIEKIEKIMETSEIDCIAVYINTPSAQYISAVTNNLHY